MFYIKKHIASLIAMLTLSAVIVSGINVSSKKSTAASDNGAFLNSADVKQISSSAAEPESVPDGRNENSVGPVINTGSPAFADNTAGDVRPRTDPSAIQRFMNITSGTTIHDSLSNSAGENIYSFTLGRRGAVSYTFYQKKPTSAKLRISLYQEFCPDGNSDEKQYRELYSVYTSSESNTQTSLPTGVYPGNYRIYVLCESSFSVSDYDLTMNFTQSDKYECENNSSITRYNELALNRSVTGSCAQLSNGLDTDCYMFEITKKGYISFALAHNDMKIDQVAYRIYIYDSYGNEYYFARSSFTDIIISSGNIALTPGYYFIKIDSHIFCETEYVMSVRFTEDNDFESELNDTKETADIITLGKEVYGNITPRSSAPDKDWFKFTVTEGASIMLDFLHADQGRDRNGWNIKMYSSDMKLIYSAVSKWTDQVVQSPFIGLSSGDYYVCVDADGLNLSASTYALLITSDSDGAWEAEPNDTFDSANMIALDTGVNGTMLENGVDFDRDVFRFTVKEKSDIKLSFAHTPLGENREGWVITLYGEDEKEITSFTSNWNTSKTETDSISLEAGDYYIAVDTGKFYSNIRYILTASKNKSSDIIIIVNPGEKDK